MRPGLGRATRQFFETTTLHGFKYLCSSCHADRWCWLSGCAASAVCAGALCAVLWARFLQVPALLTVRSPLAAAMPLPAVTVCLPPASVAYMLVGHLSSDEAVVRRLILTFSYILQGKAAKTENLVLLERLLAAHNVTVLDALYRDMPPCGEFAKRCHWQKEAVPCEQLFHRELTQYGVCCVMKPYRLKAVKSPHALFFSSGTLGLVLQCANASLFFGCQMFTMYEGEETVNPVTLVPGSEYAATLTYSSVQDGDAEELLAEACISGDSYSRRTCLVFPVVMWQDTCMERHCGCYNPLRTIFDDKLNVLPPCQLWQLNCLQKIENTSCNCMPSCTKFSTDLSLQDNIMKSVAYTLDPLYSGLNVSAATVIKLRVHEAGSKIFTRQPTETWFTLLSSLGGVFNMFLGVGLFSALELLFFVLVRVPAAVNAAPELRQPVTQVHARH